MSTKTNFNLMFHSHPILNFTFPTPSTFPLQRQMNPNECVCVKIWHLFHIRDKKYRFEINFYVFN
jgi:hypothetical protein